MGFPNTTDFKGYGSFEEMEEQDGVNTPTPEKDNETEVKAPEAE